MQQLNAEETQESSGHAVYWRFAPTILAYLSQQLPNFQDAEDLLLEIFMAALKHEGLANLSEERQLAWLRRVARNKVIDRYRHAALLTFLPLECAAEIEDDQPSPEEQVERQETYMRLLQALRHLSPGQQELLQLRYGNDLHFAEIATLLAKPEGTLRKLLVRTLRQLRKHYHRLERNEEA